MGNRERIRHAVDLSRMVARHPGELRFVWRWAHHLRVPTLSSQLPWLPFSLVQDLHHRLPSEARVFEFGGGGSTLWFVRQGYDVDTVEHDKAWHRQLVNATVKHPSCNIIYCPAGENFDSYVATVQEYPDETFDMILVDGRERMRCIESARGKVRPGGLLVLDDSNRTRYQGAFELLRGWSHHTYEGFAPFKPLPATTTVWVRPSTAAEEV